MFTSCSYFGCLYSNIIGEAVSLSEPDSPDGGEPDGGACPFDGGGPPGGGGGP